MFAFTRAATTSILLSILLSLSASLHYATAAEQEKSAEAADVEKSATSSTNKTNNPKKASTETDTTEKKSAEANQTTSSDQSSEDNQQNKRVINAPIDAFKQQQQDIKHYLNNEEFEAILVGTDEYILLTDNHKTAINKGVMILVPDWQQSATSPNAMKQLRHNMPNQGWTTLTLHPPHQPGNYPSQALDLAAQETENTEALTKYKEKLATILTAVTNKAKNYPGVIILIAEGQHAALVVDMIHSKLIDPPGALVMLSSYMPIMAENKKLAENIAVSNYPVLDLYLKRDHRFVLANTKIRKDRAINEMKVYYRQKQLTNQATGYYPKYSLSKAILGWLKAIGW